MVLTYRVARFCSCALPHREHLLWVVTVIVRPQWRTLWRSILMPVRWSYVTPHQRQRPPMSLAWVTSPPPATRNQTRVMVSVGLPPICFFIFIHVQKMWIIRFMLIISSSCPQPLRLLSIGPVWTTLPINPVRHKLVLVMSPFFVVYTRVQLWLMCPWAFVLSNVKISHSQPDVAQGRKFEWRGCDTPLSHFNQSK